MDLTTAVIHRAEEMERETAPGVRRVMKEPATKAEIREALTCILSASRTCWSGEDIIEALKKSGFEVEDPNGQPLFLGELTAIARERGLSLALTTTPGVRRWIILLLAVP